MTDNRSFFLDEANLARNVVEKTTAQFFSTLDYDQYAPPLFLVETKMIVEALGVRDYVFRLLPFICGLLSLYLFWQLLKRWGLSLVGQIYGLGLLSFSELAIRYSTEFKQYSSDTLIAVALLWWTLDEANEDFDKYRIVFWILAGVIGMWYSMPAVFMLSGVASYFLCCNWKEKRMWPLLIVGLCWAGSFLAYYILILNADIGNETLQDFHDRYFIKFLPLSFDNYHQNFELVVSIFRSALDKSTVSIVFGLLMFCLGVRFLFINMLSRFYLLLIPIVALLVVSSLQFYSLIPRMTLFILPSIILVVIVGLDRLWGSTSVRGRLVLGLLVCFSLVNKKGLNFFMESLDFGDTKTVLRFLEKNKHPEETVYVHHSLLPSYFFYTELSDSKYVVPHSIHGHWNKSKLYTGHDYILWGHAPSEIVDPLATDHPDLDCQLVISESRLSLYRCGQE